MSKIKIIIERLENEHGEKTIYEAIINEGDIFELEQPLKQGLLSIGFNEKCVDELFCQ